MHRGVRACKRCGDGRRCSTTCPTPRCAGATRWRAGVFVSAVGFELAKKGAGLVPGPRCRPTFATIYGAFATVPIFLIWLYLGWVIVLLGRGDRRLRAQPVQMHIVQRSPTLPGYRFQAGRGNCCASLAAGARKRGERGLGLVEQMASDAATPIRCRSSRSLGAAGRARLGRPPRRGRREARHVLLCDPDDDAGTAAALQRCCSQPSATGLRGFWQRAPTSTEMTRAAS